MKSISRILRTRTLASWLGLLALAAGGNIMQPSPTLAQSIVHRASGSGGLFINGEYRVFAFEAVEDSDGNVTGQIAHKSPLGGGLRTHITVQCMLVQGNEAILSGPIEPPHPTPPVGNFAVVRVVDNGEGNAVDEMSLVFIGFLSDLPLPPDPTCADLNAIFDLFFKGLLPGIPAPELFPIETGNIQVE